MHTALPALPLRVASLDGSVPVHDTAASRSLESLAQAGVPDHTLMKRAGESMAKLAMALAPHSQRIVVLAGPGNNGGDGLVCAQALHLAGRPVQLAFFGQRATLPHDATWAFDAALAAGVSITAAAELPTTCDLAIDALLGLGARPLSNGPLAQAVAWLNRQALVLAMDLPTGLNADTGQPMGSHAVKAHHTLALLSLKPGLLTAQGRDLAGSVWLDSLGADLRATPATAHMVTRAQLRDACPARPHSSHKGLFGDVAVVGGAHGMTGAAVLAAHAAHAAGAGRVFANFLDVQSQPPASLNSDIMLRPQWWRGAPESLRQSTVVCGCGGGDAVAETLPVLLSRVGRLVLDADALNCIAQDSGLRHILAQRTRRGWGTVMTPHPLEAARLLNCSAAHVQADRLSSALQLANEFSCTVVLKGSGTVVAHAEGSPYLNPTGNGALASGGTGDVLAGWLAGMWATQAGRDNAQTGLTASLATVWLHGHAADLHAQYKGRHGVLTATELIPAMSAAASQVLASPTSHP